MSDTDTPNPNEETPTQAATSPDTPAEPAAANGAEGQGTEDQGEEDVANTPTAEEFEAMRTAMLRAMAEAENVRKQSAKEIADSRKYAVTNFARDLLSVADNFDRALKAMPAEARAKLDEGAQNLLTGVEMTEKELHAALSRHGVEPIPADKGTKFDPNLHQAAAQIPSDQPKDTIAEVIQAGWTLGERTLRPAMVAVSSGTPATAAAPASTGGQAGGQASGATGAQDDHPAQADGPSSQAGNTASAAQGTAPGQTNDQPGKEEPGNRVDTTI